MPLDRHSDGWMHFPARLAGSKLRVEYPIRRRQTEESVTIMQTRPNRQRMPTYCADPETYTYAIDWLGGTATSVKLVATQGPVRFAQPPRGVFATYRKRRYTGRAPVKK